MSIRIRLPRRIVPPIFGRYLARLAAVSTLVFACAVSADSPELQSKLRGAAYEGNLATIHKLIADGVDLHKSEAVAIAMEHGREDAVKLLIERGASANGYRDDGKPITRAAYSGNERMIKYLIDHGADPNAESPADSSNVNTPLLRAVYDGKLDAARLLLKHGADAKRANRNGNTALEQAVIFTQGDPVPFVKLLLAHGADPDAHTGVASSARQYARSRKAVEIVALMESAKPAPIRPRAPAPVFRHSLAALTPATIEDAMKLTPGSIREVSPRSGVFYYEAIGIQNQTVCEHAKEFVQTVPETRVLVAICGNGPFDEINIDDTVAVVKGYLDGISRQIHSKERLTDNMLNDRQLPGGQRQASFLMPLIGHGIEFIPTTAIVDPRTHTSFVVQIAVGDQEFYELVRLQDIGTRLHRRIR